MSVEPAGSPAEWVDVVGCAWRVTLPPRAIVLESESSRLELPAERWRQDLYVARHGSGFIVRVEHFDHPARFVLSGEQAGPMLAHLGVTAIERPAAPDAPALSADRLLWPRVSALAVWALLCSSLAFLPVVGLVPGIAAIVLLVLHRRRVRRSAAHTHSRRVCAVAATFVIAGFGVSALTTWGLLHFAGTVNESRFHAEPAPGSILPAAVCGVFVVLLSLTVHEAAHAITAWWLGDGYAHSVGRVTLNPLAHIDLFGTVLLPAMLAWTGAPVFGYARPVPVRVEGIPRWRRAHILVSLAGPGSNLLLASASMILLLSLTCGVRLAFPAAHITNLTAFDFSAPLTVSGFAWAGAVGPMCMVLKLGIVVNVSLAFFNLIPIPPLDGSWVLEHLFPGTLGKLYRVARPYGFMIFLLCFYYGAFDILAYPLAFIIGPAMILLGAATGF